MPISYEVEPDDLAPVIYSRFTGKIGLSEVTDFFEQVLKDSRVHSRCLSLVNALEAESLGVSAEEVRWLSELNSTVPKEKQEQREAIVARENSVEFGLARMFELLSPGRTIRVFTDLDEARDWLLEVRLSRGLTQGQA